MSEDSSPKKAIFPVRVVILTNIIAIVAAASTVILSLSGIFPFEGPLGVYRILPGNILIDFLWVWIIAIIMGVLLFLLTPYLSGVYLGLHRIMTGGGYEYHLQSLESKEGSRSTGQLLVPSFVALGLSFTITNISNIVATIFVVESFDGLPEGVREPLLSSMPLFFILLLIATIISFVFAPAWLLEDLGIICRRKGDEATAYIEGVGNWYLALLKGFAGISTILAYIFTSVDMVNWYQILPTYGVEVPIWLYLIPVLVIMVSPAIALAPISISYTLYLLGIERNSRKLRKMVETRNMEQVTITVKAIDS
ncbi:MAG: hypothetical protein ACFFED_17685 [Candidatus Thorarchaeota archaeon]